MVRCGYIADVAVHAEYYGLARIWLRVGHPTHYGDAPLAVTGLVQPGGLGGIMQYGERPAEAYPTHLGYVYGALPGEARAAYGVAVCYGERYRYGLAVFLEVRFAPPRLQFDAGRLRALGLHVLVIVPAQVVQGLAGHLGYGLRKPLWSGAVPQVHIPRVDAAAGCIHHAGAVVLVLEYRQQFVVHIAVRAGLARKHRFVESFVEPYPKGITSINRWYYQVIGAL